MTVHIRPGEPADVPVIARLIRELARYEKLEHEVVMTEELLAENLFGPRRYAETLIAEEVENGWAVDAQPSAPQNLLVVACQF